MSFTLILFLLDFRSKYKFIIDKPPYRWPLKLRNSLVQSSQKKRNAIFASAKKKEK